MITIYCALYEEAQYLIQHYELKNASVSRHFQVFANDKKKVRLVITGVGKTNAAVAVAEISTIYPPAREDIMINYGSCAAEKESAGGVSISSRSVVMVNKLTDVESGRTFYPDMIYRHPFSEGEVETSVHVYTASERDESVTKAEFNGQTVHDMEAAAFYEAGNFFYGPHQMMFLKVVTDHGMNPTFDRNRFAQIMQTASVAVAEFLDGLLAFTSDADKQKKEMKGDIQVNADHLAEDLHCSVTMRAELTQLLTYWRLAGFDAETVIDGYYKQGILPCKDKRAGRRLLDELQNKWL